MTAKIIVRSLHATSAENTGQCKAYIQQPPSVALKEIFDVNKEDPFSAQVIQEAAKKVLLPPYVVSPS